MKLLLINSTNSALRICKNESENCRPRQEFPVCRVLSSRAAVFKSHNCLLFNVLLYCCYFHFNFNYSFNFNCSLNHFWAKQQPQHIRMAKLHKSFMITVTLVVCFVHFSNVVFMFYAHIGDNLTDSRLRGN